jgi:hypothetical protein
MRALDKVGVLSLLGLEDILDEEEAIAFRESFPPGFPQKPAREGLHEQSPFPAPTTEWVGFLNKMGWFD